MPAPVPWHHDSLLCMDVVLWVCACQSQSPVGKTACLLGSQQQSSSCLSYLTCLSRQHCTLCLWLPSCLVASLGMLIDSILALLQRIAGNCQLANMTTPTAEAPEGYCQNTCDRCFATTAPVSAPTVAPTVVPQPPPAPVVFSPPPPPAATPSPTSVGTPSQSITQPPPASITLSPPPPPPSPTSPNLQVCNAQTSFSILTC